MTLVRCAIIAGLLSVTLLFYSFLTPLIFALLIVNPLRRFRNFIVRFCSDAEIRLRDHFVGQFAEGTSHDNIYWWSSPGAPIAECIISAHEKRKTLSYCFVEALGQWFSVTFSLAKSFWSSLCKVQLTSTSTICFRILIGAYAVLLYPRLVFVTFYNLELALLLCITLCLHVTRLSLASWEGRFLRKCIAQMGSVMHWFSKPMNVSVALYLGWLFSLIIPLSLIFRGMWNEWTDFVDYDATQSKLLFARLSRSTTIDAWGAPFASTIGQFAAKLLASFGYTFSSGLELVNLLAPDLCSVSTLNPSSIWGSKENVVTCSQHTTAFTRDALVSLLTSLQAPIDGYSLISLINEYLTFNFLNGLIIWGSHIVTLLASLWYMLAAETSVTQVLIKAVSPNESAIQLIIEGEKLFQAIFRVTLKRALFYGFYGFFFSKVLSWPLPWTVAFVCLVLGFFPYVPVEVLIWLICFWTHTVALRWGVAIINFAVWWVFLLTIHAEIPHQNPYVIGLAVAAGIAILGPVGVLVGPFLAALPTTLIHQLETRVSSPKKRDEQSKPPASRLADLSVGRTTPGSASSIGSPAGSEHANSRFSD
eukprot:Gregarina_sp_Poly_1__4208@NODE_229_length_11141_cov_173_244537_g203_i0_p3_GENE_NODE_229_length_11141_cov_173_244537_g203_i0NODE_229_length_11141_cov_173_244537_g203_i0_p3_ORF_typecomplete_len590_score53_10AI2E_transport/PF01594_16/14AI2E_transport/PF01594_16/1_4e02AI2E_transport/PF01594_16/1_6e10_NODE_229_length_11141_cov_173_244537_g203_i07402509